MDVTVGVGVGGVVGLGETRAVSGSRQSQRLVGAAWRRHSSGMAVQPMGTVTLLFTDIEGSTRLLERLGRERYAEALDLHRALLRRAFESHGGFEVDCEGDAFFVAFSRAEDAVAAASEAQRALVAADWPEGQAFPVRMGIHTGEPLVVPPKYVGLDVHRASRVMASGHGGQVLLSQTTRALIGEDMAVRDLGEHRLRDLSLPQRLYQLRIEGLRSDFPALKTLENRPTNLPVQPTPLIGREHELQEMEALLLRDDVRLVTLTGVGGTGKTRLALHTAADLIEHFDNGVFFVSLAPVTDASLVIPMIAQTLGLREQAGQALADTIGEYLRDKEMLLLVDNFEHVVEAAPAIAALLSRAPALRVLATSRMPLRLAGEHLYAVPPLGLPDAGSRADLEALTQVEAVRLFISRARAARADFVVTAENAPAVAEVCVRVDGLPLAIELAAARIGVLSPEAMLSRLDQRLKLLTGGGRDRDLRQQTLRDTIAWSFDLLAAGEKALFARLSVFADGCRIDAAETVCVAVGDPNIDVFDGLTSLVEKSLLRQRDDADGEPRFWMLETIREYATEQLDGRGDSNDLRRRHAEHYLAQAVSDASALRGHGQSDALARLDQDLLNLRAALERAALMDGRRVAQAAATLVEFWELRGQITEGRKWITRALDRSMTELSAERAALAVAAGRLAERGGDLGLARSHGEDALRIYRALDDSPGVMRTLGNLGTAAGNAGDLTGASSLFNQALDLAIALADPWAQALQELNLSAVALLQSNAERASLFGRRAAANFARLGDEYNCAAATSNHAFALLMAASLDDARDSFERALRTATRLDAGVLIINALIGLGAATIAAGEIEAGIELLSAAESRRADLDVVLDAHEHAVRDRATADTRSLLAEERVAAAWARGQKLDLEAVVPALDIEAASP